MDMVTNGKKARSFTQQKKRKAMWGLAFIAPTMFLVLVLNIWPVFQTAYMSLNRIHGLGDPVWIGFENYRVALTNPELWRAFLNTAKYTVVTVPIGIFLSLVTAVLLNQDIKGKTLFRVLYFIPVVSAPAAIALVWRWLFHSEFGLINYALSRINISGPNWLGNPSTALFAVMIVGIWAGIGYNMIIFLSGLQGINKSYYEAAKIDGANVFQQFFKITLPLISPTLFFVLTTGMIGAFQVFDLIFMMIDSAGPSVTATRSVVLMFYSTTFVNGNRGMGSAIAIIILLVILIVTAIQMLLQKKWVHYDQ